MTTPSEEKQTDIPIQTKPSSVPEVAKRVKEIGLAGQQRIRETFARLPADFLIINDLTFENVPATAISIGTESDVFVAETLRTSTPTVQPFGRGFGNISIQLVFRQGKEQQVVLHRLMTELLNNPFVFIENNKIRQALEVVGTGTLETMAFALLFGSLSTSEQSPDCIILDLQFGQFNYQPFSHHFWYSQRLAGYTTDAQNKLIPNTSNVKRHPVKLFPYEGIGYQSYDFSTAAIQDLSACVTEHALAETTQLGPIDSPVVFPSQSPAYQYYVDHLLMTAQPVSSQNTDYIKFVWDEYQIVTPPEEASSDTTTLQEFFKRGEPYDEDTDPLSYERALPGETARQTHSRQRDQERSSSGQKRSRQRREETTEFGRTPRGSGSSQFEKQKWITGEIEDIEYCAEITGGNRGQYIMTGEDRLWLARMLCAETRAWTNDQIDLNKARDMYCMAWSMINRWMMIRTGGSFGGYLTRFSQPLKGAVFNQTFARSRHATEGYNDQALNQYKGMTAAWPGARGARKLPGKRSSVIPTDVAWFVNAIASGRVPPPKNLPGLTGHYRDYKHWGKLTRNQHGAPGFWKQGNSGEDWFHTNFAAEYFATSGTPGSTVVGQDRSTEYHRDQHFFKVYPRGEMYMQDTQHKSESIKTIKMVPYNSSSTRATPPRSNSIVFVQDSSRPVPDVWGPVESDTVIGTENKEYTAAAQEDSDQLFTDANGTTTDKIHEEQNRKAEKEKHEQEYQQAKAIAAREEARIKWINEQINIGWIYVGTKEIKNLFVRSKDITLGGELFGENSAPNIAVNAASMQFGHRLAKHKLIGQEVPTWQFLGAGNKSGLIVLTAAGETGRNSLQRVKRMYSELQANARNIGGIEGSSSCQIEYRSPTTDKINNIFALAHIRPAVTRDVSQLVSGDFEEPRTFISITNISDESVVQEGVDVYRMSIEFMISDKVEETFDPAVLRMRNAITQKDKNHMLTKMLNDLVYYKASPGERVGGPESSFRHMAREVWDTYTNILLFVPRNNPYAVSRLLGMHSDEADREIDNRYAFLAAARQGISKLRELKKSHQVLLSASLGQWDSEQHKPVAREGVPEWYLDILTKLAGAIQRTANDFPLLNYHTYYAPVYSFGFNPVDTSLGLKGQGGALTWEQRIRESGDEFGGIGDHLVSLIGGKGTIVGDGLFVRGYNVYEDPESSTRRAEALWASFLQAANQAVQEALRKTSDEESFKNIFGIDIWNTVLDTVLSEFGECYGDMKLPKRAFGDTTLSPEFYMYDDSLENAALTQLTTGSGGLAKAIDVHVQNQAESIQKFINGRLMGGLQVSKNASRIASIHNTYKKENIFNKESVFLGATGGFAGMDLGESDENTAVEEALRTFDAVRYISKHDRTKIPFALDNMPFYADAISNWKLLDSASQLSDPDLFLTNIIAASGLNSFLSEGKDFSGGNPFPSEATETKDLYRDLREYYFMDSYGAMPEEIYLGPSIINTKVDKALSGVITNEVVRDMNEDPMPDPVVDNTKAESPDPQPHANTDGAAVLAETSELIDPQTQKTEQLDQLKNLLKNTSPEADPALADRLVDIMSKIIEESYSQSISLTHEEVVEQTEKRFEGDLVNKQQIREQLKLIAQTQQKELTYAYASTATAGTAMATPGAYGALGVSTGAQERKYQETRKTTAKDDLKDHYKELHQEFRHDNRGKQIDQIIRHVTSRMKKDISLRRAYPTFKIYLINQNAEASGALGFQAFDDFYSYSAIQEIRITRSRHIAADLAVIRLTDVAQKLTRARFSEPELDHDRLKGSNPLGWEAETLKENPFGGGVLQEGVKVQIRLGYAGHPTELETVFLGQIVEIGNSEESRILEIICQGYGAELEAANMDSPEASTVYYSTQHALSSAILQPYIKNFGHWTFNQEYNPAQIRNRFHEGGKSPFSFSAGMQADIRHLNFMRIRHMNFRNNPEDDNIFAPPPWTYVSGWARFWNNACLYRPMAQTPWEVFKEHELRHPGYVSLALPYGHEPRMTMFFGTRGQFYWKGPPTARELNLAKYWTSYVKRYGGSNVKDILATDVYLEGLAKLRQANASFYNALMKSLVGGNLDGIGQYIGGMFGRYRPFRNYHVFTSEHHIIQNEIHSSLNNTFNAVEIRYAKKENIPKKPDDMEGITEALKKVEEYSSGLLTLQLNDNIPENQIRTYEDYFPSCVTEYMARRYAQGLLIQGAKESYSGTLTVTGEETIKPYDIVLIRDHYTDMYGPIEVESVTHIFSRNTGFVSVITPDLCVDANDWFAKGWMDSILHSWSLVHEIAERQKNMNTFREIPISTGGTFSNIMTKLGAFHFIHWDQFGSPMCITPLMHKSKPLMALSTAPRYASTISNLWGRWHQWWEDFYTGFHTGGVPEQMFILQDDLLNRMLDWFGVSQGGSHQQKGR